MKELKVYIEIKGEMTFVGIISGTEVPRFSYNEEYVDNPDSRPVSISLPLQKESFSPDKTRIFFDGLLPEGFTRKTVADIMHTGEEDYLSILKGLGRECLGAIKITDGEDEDVVSDYDMLSLDQVRALAREGTSRSASIVAKTHLSLTGASGKAGLYLNPANNKWYLPLGDAPSTHIVKQSHVRLEGIVANEQLCLMTASKLGIDVPGSFIINTGSYRDDEILYAISRYDRIIHKNGKKIKGLAVPQRLHQEDFAQAMSIAAAGKYERSGDSYFKKMFEIIRKYSASPIEDQLKLWDNIVFDYLVGNTDNHIKNFSLLYDASLKSVRLAPTYDILSTAIYESSTRNMAFAIGGISNLDKIKREDFEAAARDAGLGVKLAMKRFDNMSSGFIGALDEAAEELKNTGFYGADNLKERIIDCGGISNYV